jgi:lipopolysaccharide/colanic/teichoic acid biosynthesis glycosyltransferase
MTIFFRDHTNAAQSVQELSAPPHYPAINDQTVYRQGGKRLLDLILVCLAAPQVVLLVGILALLVACTGGKPFYSQLRVGRHGRLYRMWKLRTMVPDADQKLESYLANNPAARAEWDDTQKLKNDPRVTAIGCFLRQSSLDELPQIWNVLRGEMSLVGPRPMMTEQRGLYPGRQYYDMRPGITGLWQISARNTSSFADRAWYDSTYNQAMSLSEDCRILGATVGVVLRGTGH